MAGKIVLNPFKHDVDAHIDRSKPEWKSKDPFGQFNIELFHLDSFRNCRKRSLRIQSQRMLKNSILDLRRIEDDIRKARGAGRRDLVFRLKTARNECLEVISDAKWLLGRKHGKEDFRR